MTDSEEPVDLDTWKREVARQIRFMRWLIIGVNVSAIIVLTVKHLWWMIPLHVGCIGYMLMLPRWIRVLTRLAGTESNWTPWDDH